MTGLTDHARRELAELTRVAEDTDREPAERAAALLIAHQRRDVGSCLCGWSEIGKSHAAHQAGELARIGLLAAAGHHPPQNDGAEHDYLSTACLHEDQAHIAGDTRRADELHAHCEAMVGYAGVKRPGQCKWCDAVCTCPRHGAVI